ADFDWKAQRRTSAGGEWTTISAYDGSWPNTVYDQYYGVGVNGTLAELSGDRKQTHGLLIDKPGDGLPTAMAWKAPKAGTVKVSIREDEPYLRQDGSNGKALTLRLMHDDKVVCFADLTVSKQRSEEFANCVADKGEIAVEAGDW
ncbi:right-handed parallel beta-helix repeat-containing protein, partial [Bacillus paranthracis]